MASCSNVNSALKTYVAKPRGSQSKERDSVKGDVVASSKTQDESDGSGTPKGVFDSESIKVARNSELLDSLVKKIGDGGDSAFGNKVPLVKARNAVNERVLREETSTTSIDVSECLNTSPIAAVTLLLPETVQGVAFERSAFVSESLDEFLSSEPAILKLNNSGMTSIEIPGTSSMNDSKILIKSADGEMKSPVNNLEKLLDQQGNKPKTLAEKRRLLEAEFNSAKKKIKLSSEKPSLIQVRRKYVKKKLKPGEPRLLRSALTARPDGVVTGENVNTIDSNPTCNSENVKNVPSSKGSSKKSKLNWKGKMISKTSNKSKHQNYPKLDYKKKQQIKRRLLEVNQQTQLRKMLHKAACIKPLPKRIFFEFMPLLKNEEIVTFSNSKKICMVLFMGVGRSLYHEQWENLQLVRKDDTIIDKNFARIATSTVVDRRKESKVKVYLLPVVSTKLINFMHHFMRIRMLFKDHLINKYNLNVSSNPNGPLTYSNTSRGRIKDWGPKTFKNKRSKQQKDFKKVLPSIVCNNASNVSNVQMLSVNSTVVTNEIQNAESQKTGDNENSKAASSVQGKLKRQLLQNCQMVGNDKQMKKLNHELRRLNHAFVDAANDSDTNESDVGAQSNKQLPEVSEDSVQSKLAKVESEFHQTVMRNNQELVFVSSFSERSSRHKKRPKKLEDTVVLGQGTLKTKLSKRPFKGSEEVILFDEEKDSIQLISQETQQVLYQDANILPPRVIQPESPKRRTRLQNKPKVFEYLHSMLNEKHPRPDVVEKGTVIVRTARSILKKNVDSMNNSINTDLSDICNGNDYSYFKNRELVIIDGKYPTLVLPKLARKDSSEIWCVHHVMYGCPCLNDTSFKFTNKSGTRNVARKRTCRSAFKKLDFTQTTRLMIRPDSTGNVALYHSIYAPELSEESVVKKEQSGNEDMVVPRIEEVMTLRPEEFFKDDLADMCTDSGSSRRELVVPNLTAILKHSDAVAHKPSKVATVPSLMLHEKAYRFYCVLFSYAFSYIKFLGGVDFNLLKSKEQLLPKLLNSEVGVIIDYNCIANLIREFEIKKQCAFQRLFKANYDHRKFDGLPFGIYAVCHNLVLFGPYDKNEPHHLQAFKVIKNSGKDDVSQEAKHIPFVKPEFLKEYTTDVAVGYWWNVNNNDGNKNQFILDAINSKRQVTPDTILISERLPRPTWNGIKPQFANVKNNEKDRQLMVSSDNNNGTNIKDTEKVGAKKTSLLNPNNILLKTMDLERRYRKIAPLDKSYKKYPVINTKGNQIMSIVYPVQNGTVSLNSPAVKQAIQDKAMSDNTTSKDTIMLKIDNDRITPIVLDPLHTVGEITYYCMRDNKQHIIKVRNVTESSNQNFIKPNSKPFTVVKAKGVESPMVPLDSQSRSVLKPGVVKSNHTETENKSLRSKSVKPDSPMGHKITQIDLTNDVSDGVFKRPIDLAPQKSTQIAQRLNSSVSLLKKNDQKVSPDGTKKTKPVSPKGVLLKLTVKGKPNMLSLNGQPDKIKPTELVTLVTTLNKRISDKSNKAESLAESVDNVSYNLTNESCSAVSNAPIVWNSSTQSFNVNKNLNAVDGVSLSKQISALSQLSNNEVDVSIVPFNESGKDVNASCSVDEMTIDVISENCETLNQPGTSSDTSETSAFSELSESVAQNDGPPIPPSEPVAGSSSQIASSMIEDASTASIRTSVGQTIINDLLLVSPNDILKSYGIHFTEDI